MIRLDSPLRKLQCLLSGAVSATQPDVVVCYRDVERQLQRDVTAQTKTSVTAGATPVDICDAPDPAVTREIDFISVRNNDTASVTVTIRYNDAGTTFNIVRFTLLTLETLSFNGAGWQVLDVNGNVKHAIAGAVAATTLSVTTSSSFPSGSWTPSLSFVTPGDVAVTYTTRLADYIDLGRIKILTFDIVTASFTHTTAAGALIISGVPTVSVTLAGHQATGSAQFGGITKAGYTSIVPIITSANNIIQFQASGSGVAIGSVVAGDVPTGGTVSLYGTLIYRVS